jgi:putative serine protease PepD
MTESVVHGEANKTVNRRRAFGGVALLVGAGIAGGAAGGAATAWGLGQRGFLGGPGAGRGSLLPALPLSAPPRSATAPAAGRAQRSGVAALYQRVAPSVVAVRTNGEGSGFVVDDKGHVVTNNHVVAGSSRVTLLLLDGTSVPAQVVATDAQNDLAVLKASLPEGKVAVATLGDSDTVTTGEAVIAVGNPFGFENSVTAGIVSAVDRQYGGSRGRSGIEGLIQTDTSINPGNSGGPLFNSAGEVIGINTMGVSPVRGSVGVAFAVPVNAAKRLLSRVGS